MDKAAREKEHKSYCVIPGGKKSGYLLTGDYYCCPISGLTVLCDQPARQIVITLHNKHPSIHILPLIKFRVMEGQGTIIAIIGEGGAHPVTHHCHRADTEGQTSIHIYTGFPSIHSSICLSNSGLKLGWSLSQVS